jgi:hypothetical protein
VVVAAAGFWTTCSKELVGAFAEGLLLVRLLLRLRLPSRHPHPSRHLRRLLQCLLLLLRWIRLGWVKEWLMAL